MKIAPEEPTGHQVHQSGLVYVLDETRVRQVLRLDLLRRGFNHPLIRSTGYVNLRSKKDGLGLLVLRFMVIFLERMSQVVSTGPWADDQLLGDLRVGQPGGEQAQDLHFPRDQASSIRSTCASRTHPHFLSVVFSPQPAALFQLGLELFSLFDRQFSGIIISECCRVFFSLSALR